MWVDRCVRDVPRALRTVRRHGRLNALVVLTLPLGIGVNLAMFSVMRGVLSPRCRMGTPTVWS